MLRKELPTGSRKPTIKNVKLLLKIASLREIWSNTVLFEIDLVKSDIRQMSCPNVKFEDDFLNIFYFSIPFSKALSQDGQTANLNDIGVIFSIIF